MRRLLTPILIAALVPALFSASAHAEAAGAPVWKVIAVTTPTNLKPGDVSGDDSIVVTATNVGGGSTNSGAITLTDVLPPGLRALDAFGINVYHSPVGQIGNASIGSGEEVESAGPPFGLACSVSSSSTASCTTSERVDPGDTLIMTVDVAVETTTEGEGELNSASVSGGGAAAASVSEPVSISSKPPAYGVAKGGTIAATSTSQAGAHPNVTSEFFLNTINPEGEERAALNNGEFDSEDIAQLAKDEPVNAPKDVHFDLPAGLVGSAVGMPRCTMADVINSAACPEDTMVGTATLIVLGDHSRVVMNVPVYNIEPSPGEPVAFAFNGLFFPVRLDTSVLSSGEYNVRVSVPDITQGGADYMSSVTIWGVPAEHNGPGPDVATRVLGLNYLPLVSFGGKATETYASAAPLLTNPSQCSTPLTGVLETDSWEAVGVFGGAGTETAEMGAATGCGQLSFKPQVSMLPDTLEAGAPAGYTFDLSLPQDNEAEGLATPDVKRTSVTLPEGTVISPSSADGLGVCSDEQFGLHSGVAGSCPRDSQVGTVRVKTPALEERLSGQVYLGAPECEPCTSTDAQDGKMVRLFVQFTSEGEDGIIVKLEGRGQINQQTGQVTTVFEDTPQLPFSEFQLTLQGGERATLANPRACGPATTTAELTPWSTPYTPDASPTSTFDVDENCFAPQFDPSFTAGTTSNQAGGFSPFTLSFGRSDADEFLNGLQVQMPPGLLGMLSKVSQCPEPQASEGTCGPESLIGEASVETGPGTDPFLVTGGKVYLTGPYKGAPYGLSVVVPAKAGPYTLSGTTGRGTVVNRSAINVNPQTAALTVTADPLPTELDGIPLQLRRVNVTIDRSEFMFNPTSCNKMAVTGTLTSTQAASANEANSFQVTNCAALKFQPKFAASTSGRTSRKNGASLDVRVAYPSSGQGTQADIGRVKVDLPKQLPSRLSTLQKACTDKVFEANPAECPAASIIGTVKVETPVMPVPLTGPVYFVSNGTEAFPNLVMVLQGDGVRVNLVGDTFISRKGITSTTIKTVPDVPFSSFELYLPEGSNSALAANGDLCKSSLVMPTELVAQDGTEIKQETKIAVTGCGKAKTAARKAKKKRKAKHTNAKRSSGDRHGRKS